MRNRNHNQDKKVVMVSITKLAGIEKRPIQNNQP